MTPVEYRAALKRLGLSISGTARRAGYHPRTGHRWADPKGKGPPQAVALLVTLIEQNRTLEEELQWLRVRVRMLDRREGS